jgi:hypothetical protein
MVSNPGISNPKYENKRMNLISRQTSKWALAGLIVSLFAACATTLAPKYDEAISDGLVTVNQKAMELFAATSGGTVKNDFEKREDKYNAVIGGVDALAIQAKARPVPKNKATKKANAYLRSRGLEVLDSGGVPSATALENISETVSKMRDTDRKQGLTAFEVSAFKGQAVTFLDQALTYESFLKR